MTKKECPFRPKTNIPARNEKVSEFIERLVNEKKKQEIAVRVAQIKMTHTIVLKKFIRIILCKNHLRELLQHNQAKAQLIFFVKNPSRNLEPQKKKPDAYMQ